MTRARTLPAASHLEARLGLEMGQYSCAGRKAINEDAIGIRAPDGPLLTTKGVAAVIADGVSSAEAGREASQSCVTGFLSDYFSTPETWTVRHSVQQILTALNRWLYRSGQGLPDARRGFITTMSALVLKSQQAHLFHIGDSRIYLLRDGRLEQLTRDHTVPVGDGHRYLARALGLDIHLEADYRNLALERGDLFLLTTDGVHDVLGAAQLAELLVNAGDDLAATCRTLCDTALRAGSDDNLSCQLLRVSSLPTPEIDDVVGRLTQLRFPPPLAAGNVLDGFRIERELHASPRSQVYLVRDVQSGERFCMKTPSDNFSDDPAYIERFVLESWIGSRINSPYVARVVDPGRPRTCLYYLSEYVDGMTLAQWMREHPRPAVEEALYLVCQIARGLRALHRRETLHQDLKPDNILIDASGQVKIIDFGSCSVASIAEIATPLVRDSALGTASYAAPEYTVGRKPDPRADLFSLAVITYELLTGTAPFEGKLERCRSQRDFLATRYTPSYRINPRVPHWMDGALRKALRFHPERRHGDVSEFAHELQHPNPAYLEYHQRPLMDRKPLLAWQLIAAALAVAELVTLALLVG
ncbi:bifunctional protein-serine/threonine kinase/phosphatase [Parahaliea mediterranea]|uniref:Bifunctional protein-serine/threonine kinase/phosphatase n=1 Tax=Parahaliea mediterranea TaxID=651086 RepID=A0A939DEN1_9GAMM|nr:bifunctional protein-serine/threonine kinase/phosphatase [Parahaliea mediterranea]MBN7796735.1 bifunctional protein-serine/threonine kinase/phosphatase [Parahaliea mediterranea]